MVRAILLVACFLGLNRSVFSQDFFYSTRNYTAIDGLPQSQVRALAEDKSGYLWIGTEGGGLARFDGREFKVYTTLDGLLTNQVIGLRFDQKDNLWILHPRGITKFDGLNFKKFQAPVSHPSSKPIRRVYTVNDTLFLLSSTGLTSKIYEDSLYYWEKQVFRDKQVWAAHVAPGGEIYFYLGDGSFMIRTDKSYVPVTTNPEMGKLRNIFNYNQDVLLQTQNGLFRLNIHTNKIEKLPWDIPHQVLLYDQKESKFWTSDGTTLFKESVKDGLVKRDTILKDVDINQVLIDSEGNTWFASNGNGLFKYFIQDFMRCSSDNMRGVMSILKDQDGASWVGTMNKGLWKIKKGKINSYVDEDDPYRNMIHCVKEAPDGTIWVGTVKGLGKYDKGKDSFSWLTRDDGLPGYTVMNIEFDDDSMWIGTGNGLCQYDGKTFKIFNIENGLTANGMLALRYLKKNNTLYLGTELGINSIKDGKVSTVSMPEISNTAVYSINKYQDSLLLIGTAGTGVVLFDPATNRRKLITTRDGLASDFIYFVAADDKDYLWIGTEKGINRVKLDKNFDVVENLHFGYENGLTGVETNQNAFFLSPKTKYFGLVDGVYEFNDLNKQQLRSFDVHLTDVQILYGEYSPREYADSAFGFFKIPYQPSLPPDKNHITFQFNRVDKRYSRSVKYKYFLENFDKTWSQPSSVNEVTYSNLPPGDYTLRIMSTNNRGSWSDTRIAYDFTVKTPFYQTASFIVGMIILVGGIVTLILFLRVRQRVNRIVMLERIRQKEQENLRKEIARDFHDEMGNQLTRIINYVSLLKLSANGNGNGNGNGHSNGNGHDLYTKVEDSAKYLYTGTRDFIWSIDPVNDELSKLFIHIRDFGEKLFEEKNINFRAFNGVKEKIKLPYGFSREANLIFKEAMTNAFKSSQAHNVTLNLKRDDNNGFEMSLVDDGVGFYTDEIGKSNGLQNIRERANRINALLRIHSVKNEGTTIVLNFTLNKTLKYGLAF
jgi:ligand-binding sensor domain-containing protein/signal transduction histidine kinase